MLTLLQTHRLWSGDELARRLDVTERTVRRDADRLRDLGYPVASTPGKHGGYRLEAGAHLPPLVLDDDETIAIAVGLRHAAQAAVAGMEDTSLRALTKIEQLLPHRLRRRVSAMHASVSSLTPLAHEPTGGAIASDALSVLAAACRDCEHVRFEYRRGDGEASRRLVQPHRLVSSEHRWYLVAWDHDRQDWRTFRVDRMGPPRAVGSHFTPGEVPGGDAAAFVAAALATMPRPHSGTLAVGAAPDALAGALSWADHTVLAEDRGSCRVEIRGDDLAWLTWVVARIAMVAPVTVEAPTELADAVHRLGARLGGATTPAGDRRGPALE